MSIPEEVYAIHSSHQHPLKPVKLLMVGVSCLDHLWQVTSFPPTSSRTPVSGYRLQGGGQASTAAVTVARLGAEVALWSVHGDDLNGRMIQQELEAYGVDCSQVQTPEGSQTIVSAILVDPTGERYIFSYHGDKLHADVAKLDFSYLEGVDCILTDLRFPAMAEAVLKRARELGIPSVGDVGNMRNWELTQYLDYLIASEECAEELLGRNDPEAALPLLKQFSSQRVGITLGEQGYLFENEGRILHVPALPVEVVDSNGAGDVFHGAYAFAVAQGFDLNYIGLFSSVVAALSCKGVGRSNLPTAKQVQMMLEERTLKELNEREWV